MNDCVQQINKTIIKSTLNLTSHGILHYLCSADPSKNFCQLIVSIFILSQYFFKVLPDGKIFSQLIVSTVTFSHYFFQ